MRIQVILNSLLMGGAQRAALQLADGLESLGNEVELVVLAAEDTDFFRSVRTASARRFTKGSTARAATLPASDDGLSLMSRSARRLLRLGDMAALRRHVTSSRPDIAVAFESYLGVVVFPAYVRSTTPLVIAERVHPAFQPVPRPIEALRPFVMRNAAATTAQSMQIAQWMATHWRIPMPIVIPNIVRSMDFRWSHGGSEPGLVLGLGRYSHQKGLDVLLRAWSLLPDDIAPSARLLWFGSGDMGPYVSLAKDLGVDHQVQLLPPTRDVASQLRRANAFVLPSRYEGFPNALAEALAGGVPTVVAESPGAVAEIAVGRAIVVPAEDPDGLARAIVSLLQDRELATRVGASAVGIMEDYSAESVVQMWHQLLSGVVAGHSTTR